MKVSVINKGELFREDEGVLESFVEFQYAIIEKDSKKLNDILEDNYVLTHMSGKMQTKQEFIDEIMDGTLNYYESIITNPIIRMSDEHNAEMKSDVTLDAKVYGIRGRWTFHSEHVMVKINEKWHLIKWETNR